MDAEPPISQGTRAKTWKKCISLTLQWIFRDRSINSYSYFFSSGTKTLKDKDAWERWIQAEEIQGKKRSMRVLICSVSVANSNASGLSREFYINEANQA